MEKVIEKMTDGDEENAKKSTEHHQITRSSEKQKTYPPQEKKNKMEMKLMEEEASTAPEPSNEEEGQEFAQLEPDTLEKVIEELMGQEDQRKGEKQNQAQKKQTTRGIVSAGTEKLEPMTETAMTAMMTMMTMKTTGHHTDSKGQTRQKKAETMRPNSAEGKRKQHSDQP